MAISGIFNSIMSYLRHTNWFERFMLISVAIMLFVMWQEYKRQKQKYGRLLKDEDFQ